MFRIESGTPSGTTYATFPAYVKTSILIQQDIEELKQKGLVHISPPVPAHYDYEGLESAR